MDKFTQFLQGKQGKELEELGCNLFQSIGLNCFFDLEQVSLNDVTSGYRDSDHFEFDYIIPENEVCLIGEITGRNDNKDIRKKYDIFIKHFNLIKNLDFSSPEILEKFSIPSDRIRLFREVTKLKGFFITTIKEKCDVTLSNVEDMAIVIANLVGCIKEV